MNATKQLSAVGILSLAVGLGLTGSVRAFEMGDGDEYRLLEEKSKKLGVQNRWVTKRVKDGLLSFGDAIHEDMTEASKVMARQLTGPLACGATVAQIDALLQVVPNRKLGNSICCAKSADSRWCDSFVDEVRYSAFRDERPPLISGVRWNDDPCHMTQRSETIVAWAAWMLDRSYESYANFNYSSHYHDKQFLHSMASSGFGRVDQEPRVLTTHKITTWAEFAFRVAEGSIPASTSVADAKALLEPQRVKAFDGAFKPYYKFPVGLLFAGTASYDSQHVRQLALGALLHTVQDSFSASHVQRERDSPLLAERGRVVHFMDYRKQDSRKHGSADARPRDATKADPSSLHPVSLGARLIACAAAGDNGNSAWSDDRAKAVFKQLLEPVDGTKNPVASGGRLFSK